MAARTRRSGNSERRMSLGEHLLELRKRLFRSAIAIVLFAIGGWFVADLVWDALREPIVAIATGDDRNAQINYPNLTSAFDIRIQIAVTVGIVAASPVWLYQVFAFLVPGLTKKERRYTFGFLLTAIPLFLGGCLAGWYVFPHIVAILTSFVPDEDASLVDASQYLGFVLKLMLAVGVAFVMPVFLVLLNFLGVVSARGILAGWRWAIIGIFVFCAIATPAADIASMFLLAIPMIILYFAAAGIAWWHDRIAARRLESLTGDSMISAS